MAYPIVHTFPITIPAGTPKATPLVTSTVFNPSIVDRIEWRFPNGCNGQVGIQIGARNVAVIPTDASQFFVRSGDSQGFDLTHMHDSGDWTVIGYNTGAFNHIVYVTFRVHRMQPEEPIPGYLMSDVVEALRGGY